MWLSAVMAVVWVVGPTPSHADDNIRPARGLLLNYDLMFEGRSVDGGAATGLPDAHPEVAPGATVDSCPGQMRAASAGRSACYDLEEKGDYEKALVCYRDGDDGGSIETTLVSLERQAACLRKLGRHHDAAALLREARGLFPLAPGFSGRCEVLVMLGDSLERDGDLVAAANEGWVPLDRMQDCIACSRLGLWDAAPSRLARLAHVRGELSTAAAHWTSAATLFGGCSSTELREARADALCFAGLSAAELGVVTHETAALEEAAGHFAAALNEMAALPISDDAATELLQLASAGAAATAAHCGTTWPVGERDRASLDATIATLHGVWLLRCSKDAVAADARFLYAQGTAAADQSGNAADPLSMPAASATRLLNRDAKAQKAQE